MRREARPPNASRVIFSCTELAIFGFSTLLGLLLRNQLLCQEAASTVINVYVIYKYVASVIRIERG